MHVTFLRGRVIWRAMTACAYRLRTWWWWCTLSDSHCCIAENWMRFVLQLPAISAPSSPTQPSSACRCSDTVLSGMSLLQTCQCCKLNTGLLVVHCLWYTALVQHNHRCHPINDQMLLKLNSNKHITQHQLGLIFNLQFCKTSCRVHTGHMPNLFNFFFFFRLLFSWNQQEFQGWVNQ